MYSFTVQIFTQIMVVVGTHTYNEIFSPWSLGCVSRKFSVLRLFCWKLIRKYIIRLYLVVSSVDVVIVILVGVVIDFSGFAVFSLKRTMTKRKQGAFSSLPKGMS